MNRKFIALALVISSLSVGTLYAASIGEISKEEAVKKATEYVPAKSEMKVVEKKDDCYEVKFYNKDKQETYKVEMDSKTKKVTEFKSKKLNEVGAKTVKLNKEAIKKIVLKEYPNAQITSIEIDSDDGLKEYNIKISTDKVSGEIEINPETGMILERDFDVENSQKVQNNQNKTLISVQKVREIALNKIPNAVIEEIELDYEKGRAIYEVEAFTEGYEYELKIDAQTGKGIALYKDVEDWFLDKEDSDLNEVATMNTISTESVKAIALKKVPNGKIVKLELDEDDNKLIYEVELVKGNLEYNLEIDATSGEIIEFEIED